MSALQNLIGKTFGELTVLKRAEDKIHSNSKRITIWTCKCTCGKIKDICGYGLRGGRRTSCGCKYIRCRFDKLIGHKFGSLVVLSRGKDRHKRSYLICKCDCGNLKTVQTNSLYRGATKSCGCLRKLEYGLAAKHSQYTLAKIHAGKRRWNRWSGKSLEFDLSFDEFIKICEANCSYCGKQPYQIKKNKGYNGIWVHNGIDRIDSNKGYTFENCTACCWSCNRAKSNKTVKEFLDHSECIVKHQYHNNINVYSLDEYAKRDTLK